MGKFGAANNLGTILGPVLVGSLIGMNVFEISTPQFGLLTPLIVMSLIMTVAAIIVTFICPITTPRNQSRIKILGLFWT